MIATPYLLYSLFVVLILAASPRDYEFTSLEDSDPLDPNIRPNRNAECINKKPSPKRRHLLKDTKKDRRAEQAPKPPPPRPKVLSKSDTTHNGDHPRQRIDSSQVPLKKTVSFGDVPPRTGGPVLKPVNHFPAADWSYLRKEKDPGI
jgi:hypothetical protein